MRNKKFLLLLFLLFLVFTSGCETARGFKQDVKNTWKHTQQDVKNTWEHMQHADDWVQKNLW